MAPAGLQISSVNTNFVINFDNTVSGINNGQFNGLGFTPAPSIGQLDSDAWKTTGMSEGDTAFGDSNTSEDFAKEDSSGGATSGGFYAFETSTSNYSLGFQPTGSDFTPGTITLRSQNQTGATITEIYLSYIIYVLNNENRTNTLNFEYSTDDTTYTPLGSLDFTSTETQDGSPSWISNNRSTNISSLSIADGEYFYLRWTGDNIGGSGSQDEFAIDDITLNFNPFSTWTGNTDTDWATAGNWSNGLPTASTNTAIPDVTNAPIIGGTTNVIVNNLTITEPEGIIINSNGTLIVNGTSSGNVTYNRNLGTENWYLVSSPVAGETYDDAYVAANSLAISGTNNAISTYVSASNSWSYMQTADAAANFNAGQGYSVRLADGQSTGDISFTGTINTESVETSSLSVGYHLLGNPFTSYVNSATFLGAANSANLDRTQIWLWNQATGMYEVKILGDAWVLAPGQGFFVNATSAGTVTFDESNQAATGNAFQKSAKTEVKLVLTDGENNRFAKLNFGDNFSKGYDFGWEGETFGGIPNSLSIFTSLLEDNVGKRYQVQSLPNSDYESMVVPVGITAAVNKEITFSAEALNLPEDLKVFLEDTSNNTFTRLDEANATYKVTLDEKLDGVGRFYLHTTQSALSIDKVTLTGVSIFKTNAATLRVTGLQQGKASISLFNVLGKQVMSTSFEANDNTDISLPKLATGVYFAQVQTATGKLSKKIILE